MTGTSLIPTLLSTEGRIAIVGYGSVSPLGFADTSYQTRTGQFEQALPEYARMMGLTEVRDGQHYAVHQIVGGRRVEASEQLRQTPLSKEDISHLYRDYIDLNIGIRVVKPEDTAESFDPQRYEQWPLTTLKEDAKINGRLYRAGERVRLPRTVKLGAVHGGLIPSGLNLWKEGGFQGPPFNVMGRPHVMMMRAAADAVVSMGRPWPVIAKRIPQDKRDVAAANGMAPGEYIVEGMTYPILGEELTQDHLGHYLSDTMAFYLGKLFGVRHASTRPAACDTGPANIEDLLDRMRARKLLFGAVATFESAVNAPSVNGFLAKKALADDRSVSLLGDHPSLISRPGLPDRIGFVMGEGGGILLLMDMGTAFELGVCIYGELLTAVTAMGPRGTLDFAAPTSGVADAMERAILSIAALDGVSPEQVVGMLDFIEGHGTSTPAGDINAILYYSLLLKKYKRNRRSPVAVIYGKGGPRLDRIPTARQAGGIGEAHLLGGAGLLHSVEGVQILNQGIYPASVSSLDQVDSKIAEHDLIYFPTDPTRAGNLRVGKVDSQGFGDSNGEVWIRRYEADQYKGGVEARNAQAESAAWRDERREAIRRGQAKPFDYLPSMSKDEEGEKKS